MRQTAQTAEATVTGRLVFNGRKYHVEDFLSELDNLVVTLNNAEHGLIGLGFEEHSYWALCGDVLSRVRALYGAAKSEVRA